ncbi:exodeoxyribonuclease VII large subunit [Demequina sediminicola]|uniref:exodeoxyribonuclease VII large subunit n=1 Tax=Demequina sediminicola TaxID=1095026 RepID=UPI0007837550|nr:exodeoxyribonuclease VII large subunit [Demequina sediminicola]
MTDPTDASTSHRATLPATAAETSPERPWPVRHLSPKIRDYVARLPEVWIEGQVLNAKRWKHMVFLTLRDTDEQMSLKVTVPASQVDALGMPFEDGARVVVHAKPSWWVKNGDLQMAGDAVRAVGLGDLLARIEMLKEALAAEGLFDPERKRPLPLVPRRVGLVCANQGDAEHDVIENAQRRWPAVQFTVRRVTVQGARCVPETTAAIAALDQDPDIDVIVVARGGGSFEDLLPFSDEALVRAAGRCETPLVSAIGHEKDAPLLDLVADYRASTPTDAGKRIVPDAEVERAIVSQAVTDAMAALRARIHREREGLAQFRSRPVLTHPQRMLDPYKEQLAQARESSRRALVTSLDQSQAVIREWGASLRALSPQSTLDRGYSIVRDSSGAVVTDASALSSDASLHIRFADGSADATVTEVH